MSTPSNKRLARAALTRLFEPSDLVGLALIRVAGAADALSIATGEVRSGAGLQQELSEVLAEEGLTGRRALLGESLQRWQPRIADLAPARDLETIRRFGGTLLIPGDDLWPQSLEDLQLGTPVALWARGNPTVGLPPHEKTIAVVGSRDSTNYGASMTGDICGGLVGRGYTVMSGGAYGVDAHAHRAALATATAGSVPTVAVLACGLDRYYPAGNEDLLRTVCEQGLLLAEVPPGVSPTRWRFLQRNRLIAAMSAAVVVVEARWRSGALNTAHHAAGLGRAVGAVPGSVYSANSAGCHRLLREAGAICVTDAAEIIELVTPIGGVTPSMPAGAAVAAVAATPPGKTAGEAAGAAERGDGTALIDGRANKEAPTADYDGLCVEDLLLLDALPVRAYATREKLASVAGLSLQGVRIGLARLELAGLAVRTNDDQWRKSTTRK